MLAGASLVLPQTGRSHRRRRERRARPHLGIRRNHLRQDNTPRNLRRRINNNNNLLNLHLNTFHTICSNNNSNLCSLNNKCNSSKCSSNNKCKVEVEIPAVLCLLCTTILFNPVEGVGVHLLV